ncbi:hypothetical protein HDV01_003679 [Terramyces sp. JEL0728]|nr:hypothetical protein HDV01_003679 [Terramyces sp. JEL0728]
MAEALTMTCTTFGYDVVKYNFDDHSPQKIESLMTDKVIKICEQAMNIYKCNVKYKCNETIGHRDSGKYTTKFTVTVIGPFTQVMNTKSLLLSSNPSQTVIIIKTIRNIILNDAGEMKLIVKNKLEEIKSQTDTQITCVGGNTHVVGEPELPQSMDMEIFGQVEQAEKARLLCLSLLEELFGQSMSQITVNPRMHYIVAGRKRVALNAIMHETNTNFYLPIPFTLFPKKDDTDTYPSTIIITGDTNSIKDAKTRYQSLLRSIESKVITKQIPCLPRKLEWLFTFRKQEIRKIMSDNSVDFSFANYNGNAITVMGCEAHLIERAIRAIKRLICDYYVASIQTANNLENADNFVRFCTDLTPVLNSTSSKNKVEIVIYRNIIEIYGTNENTKQAYQDLTASELIKIRDTKIQIELGMEHREFINGKKNGKINRITKVSGCRIVFQENPNAYNMMIDLYSSVPNCLLTGIAMLEEELPAEMSFHIPEAFHKRIIGVGGKNIQKIMKRYGVYVKFSNTEEYAQLGGYYENEDNVICRTPSKNAENLKDLKATIIEAVNATELIESQETIELPRQLTFWFSGVNREFINRMESEFRIRVSLPDKESGIDLIKLDGPTSLLPQIKAKFQVFSSLSQTQVPFISNIDIPGTVAAFNLFNHSDFSKLKSKLKVELDLDIVLYFKEVERDFEVDFAIFLLHPSSLSINSYAEAKNSIIKLFTQHQVPFTSVSKSESYANLNPMFNQNYDSFQHFNSKLLAPSSTETPPQVRNSATGFGGFFSSSGSVPNIRQLFDETPAAPPGLIRSGSDARPKATSVIGRPAQMRTPLNEKTDYLRQAALNRTAITMPDLSVLGVGKSASMNDIMQAGMNQEPTGFVDPFGYRSSWAAPQFNKSLSSAAIMTENTGLPPSYPREQPTEYPISPTDIEFDQKMEDQVLALDKQDSGESNSSFNLMIGIARVLESIDHAKYLPLFIEHEIDYQTFLTLEDADLKELGIKALGSRKKILSVIKECNTKPKASRSPEHN